MADDSCNDATPQISMHTLSFIEDSFFRSTAKERVPSAGAPLTGSLEMGLAGSLHRPTCLPGSNTKSLLRLATLLIVHFSC